MELTKRPPAPRQESQATDPALSLVVVASFSSLAEASLLVGDLEAAGIEACIPEETSPVFSGVISLQPLTVRVAAKDAAEARAIASEWKQRVAAPVEEEAPASRQKGTDASRGDEPLSGPRKLCVSCGAAIPISAALCPKCGYTQPPAPGK